MNGLSVDGFTVEWGADTRQYEMANKRVRDDAKRTAFTVEKEWQGAQKKTAKQLLGFSNVAKAAMVGVGASVGIATKGAMEFAKVNEEAGHELAALQKSAKDFWVSVGADAAVAFGVIKDGIDLMTSARNYFVDLFQGEGASKELKDAMAGRKAGDKLFADRSAVTGKSKEARAEALGAIEVGDARYLDAQREMIQKDLDAAAKGVQADLISGDAIRVARAREVLEYEQQIANIKWNAAMDAEDNWWKEARARQKEREDAKAQVVEEEQRNSERRQKERDEFAEKVKDQKALVAEAQALAEIEATRQKGKTREADIAQAMYEAEKNFKEVMAQENVDLFARLDAGDAIFAARDATIAAIERKRRGVDIGGSLAAGSFSNQAFAQAFGGKGADLKTVEKDQLKVLENIEKNTRMQNAVLTP